MIRLPAVGILIFLPLVLSLPLTSPRNDEYRLPSGAVDSYYYRIQLSMGSDVFETNIFEGYVEVYFINLLSTNEIKIHANKLDISSVLLVTQNGNKLELLNESFDIDERTDILTITAGTTLSGNSTYLLAFNYTGILRTDEMAGFYRSYYTAEDGSTRYLGTTQMQPTHARKVFPCFDEPSYKAEFDIFIRHPQQYNALGNTLRTRRSDSDPNFAVTSFATTPLISTYLIAFVVSDFTCTNGDSIEENIPHSICSREEAASTRSLGLDVGPKLTHVMENYVGIKYNTHKIPKIHQVAIPDFSAGAMENWGLVTYRETALLWDSEESSNRYKQRVETVVAHELAHFWFGNLVTCHWWSDTFLNEGFATYFEYFATDVIEPSWEMEKQFVIEVLEPSLVSDASTASSALSSPASSPTDVSGRFSTISYSKGGSVFRMVRSFMGLENFQNALNLYLDTHKFGAVTPSDLWTSMSNYFTPTAGQTLPTIMANWVEKPGFPVITVRTTGQNIILSQKRFLSSSTVNDSTTWWVPISYSTSSDSNKFQETAPQIWLEPSGADQIFENILRNQDDWIILNNQQTGYYRIDYSDDLWAKIRHALNQPGFDGIHEINRAQLVDDIFNFARYGYRSFHEVLVFYEYLKKETSYYPWYAALTAINTMMIRIGNDQLKQFFSTYVLDLVEVLYNSVPFDENKDDDQIYTHKKVLAVPWACRLGLKKCIDNALAAFDTYKTEKIKPNKNMRSVVYCNGLRHSTNITEDWELLWNEFLTTKLATEELTILSALGCATDETVLKNYLRKSIDPDSGIRMQDALSVFSAVYTGNPEGVDVALDFLLENFQDISNFYTSMNSIPNLFNGLAARFTKQEQIDKLRDSLESGNLGDHSEVASSALNVAVANLAWIEQFEEEMNLYFVPPAEGDGSTADAVTASFVTIVISVALLTYQYLN